MYYDGITFTDEQEKAVKGIINFELKKQIMRFQNLLRMYWRYYSCPDRFFEDHPHLRSMFDEWEADRPLESELRNPETYYFSTDCGCEELFNLWLFKFMFSYTPPLEKTHGKG